MTNSLKHLFICLITFPKFSLWKCLLTSFALLLVGLSCFLTIQLCELLTCSFLFIFLMVFFSEKKFLILMKSHLPLFSFMVFAFCALRKFLPSRKSHFFSFFFRWGGSFIVLALAFKSVINFELLFVYNIRLRFIFPLMAVESCQHYLWREYHFPHWISLTPLPW